jgi:hypothetical protein
MARPTRDCTLTLCSRQSAIPAVIAFIFRSNHEYATLKIYAENRRWTLRGVTYVTLNIPGSCNNLCDTAPDTAEYKARNAANITWLKESFAAAKKRQSVAVMIIAQANPGWDLSDPTRAPLRDPKTLAETGNLPASDPAGAIKAPDGYQEYLGSPRIPVKPPQI